MAVSLPLPLASESQQPYVSELLSFTLGCLHKEPELLLVDAERIRGKMQEVAVGNYRSFIAAADALLAIRREVSSVDKHHESLFLRCQEAWLTGILEDLDRENPYEYLKRMINCHSMHLFDVVNRYQAIFADE